MKKLSLLLIICFMAASFGGCLSSRISPGEDFSNHLASGYLYTGQLRPGNKDEKTFLGSRGKAVDIFIDSIRETSGFCFRVTDGMEKYEDNLLGYIDKITNPSPGQIDFISSAAENIIAYKTILGSLETEIRTYLKAKSSNKAVSAVIDSYLVFAVCRLIERQNGYLAELMADTAAVSIILGETSLRQTERLLSSSASVYRKKIEPGLDKMLFEYDKASRMHSYIVSADYYVSGYYLDESERLLENLKSMDGDSLSSDEIALCESLIEQIKATQIIPLTLVPVPEARKGFSLLGKVMAEEQGLSFLGAGIAVADATGDINKDKFSSGENAALDDFSAALSDIKDGIAQDGLPYNANPAVEPSAAFELSDDSTVMAAAQAEAENKRALLLEAIQNGQNVLFFVPTDTAKYYLIQKLLLAQLDKNKDKFSAGQVAEITDLIQNDLEVTLGDSKGRFINAIVSTKADELIDTFNGWKNSIDTLNGRSFEKEDLIGLLNAFGIEVTDDKNESEASGPSPSSSSSPPATHVPGSSVSSAPGASSEPTPSMEPSEDAGNTDISHIYGFYQTILEIDAGMENADIIKLIYGWTDLLDYGDFKKEESKDSEGRLTGIRYLDENNDPVGWETRIYTDTIEYTYRFPGDRDRGIFAIRYGSYENSILFEVRTEDKTIDRRTAVRFRQPGDPKEQEKIAYIMQVQANKRDGLNTTLYNGDPTYVIYDMEEELESYTYRNGILIREVQNSHAGPDVRSDIKLYYDNGDLKISYGELNGKKDGTSVSYYENGRISFIQEYSDGIYHGKVESYYEDGTLNEITTYERGLKTGPAQRNYSNGNTEFTGAYLDGKQDGVWLAYLEDGTIKSEIGYKAGVPDGIYHIYATGTGQYDSIHTIGYYTDGKKSGIWEYGYNNAGYAEKYLYENDIMIWKEYAGSGIRTYYKSDGTVDRTEPAG
ncbi:MAG: toxin-antitoxin system YwqK family antitoxin [Clostridia bacterium]|nr:toxin-antitoxin system YwqK family antitoxin [Clostridia bacterium]